MKYSGFFFLALALVAGTTVAAQDTPAPKERATAIPGFIFNASNLLLDLDTYEGGVGITLLYPDFSLRASAGGSYASSTDRLGASALFAFEKPFFAGIVTPYWGADVHARYTRERSEIDADDWSLTQAFTAALGLIAGIEFSITDHLAVFAEYSLSGGLAWSDVSVSVAGELTATPTTSYQVSTGLGNNASLGVVVYLRPTRRATGQEQQQKKK